VRVNLERLSSFLVPGTDEDVEASYRTLAERARTAAFGFDDEVAVVDVETTGYDPDRDRIIEIAAAIVRGPEIVGTFSALVDPLIPVPSEISKLTGLTDDMLAGQSSVEAAVVRLVEFIGDRDIVAHNASFDRSFIERVAGRTALRGSWLDSLQVVRIGLPRLRSHRLTDLAAAFGVVPEGPAHRALPDVEALAAVWRIALVGLSDLPRGLLHRLTELAPTASWPVRAVLARVAAAEPPGGFFDLKDVRRRRVAADKAESLHDADEIECACPEHSEVLGEFSEGGIAGRMYDGYEARAEQLEMAGAVLEAFRTRTHAAIEAGTGVGKSVAYLVPAALYSLQNNVGVGVATKTNALMDQLVYHELPKLNQALGGELRYAALKGYDHYPCLRKLERYASELEGADDDRLATVAALYAWTAQSSWGDLDAINLHWGRREVRAGVSASQADCTRKRCRFYPNLCYLHGVRRRAASANVIVTNHALLFRDVVAQGGILPPIRHWIVDEAHSAESEARKQLTSGASHVELSAVLGALNSKSRGGLLENLRRTLRGADSAAALGVIARLEDQVARCSTISDSLFDFVKDLAPLAGSSDYDSAQLWLTAETRESGPWGTVSSTGAALAKRLESAIADGRELMTLLEEMGTDFTEGRADLVGLFSRLAEQYAGLVAVLDGEDEGLVYSATLDRRRDRDAEKLVAERLDVGEVLVDDLYPRVQSVVFTSATIATGESFEHFARAVGLDRLAPGSWRSLRLASSYDFERQMAAFVPTDMSLPAERGYLTDLERLLEEVHVAMGGSVLTLFTNRRDMEHLHAILEPRLERAGISLLCQKRGTSAKRLRDEFLADERLSLFALKSFWEGFDAKGDTLRCVIVPKLPFGRPTDPLAQERERREGRQAWSRYTLPEAVLELKQAAGRLIRSRTDHGCLVIADARVVAKGYGREFISALPVADIEKLPAKVAVEEIRKRFGR
jgi:ATP-dependent DNA helicase DinG